MASLGPAAATAVDEAAGFALGDEVGVVLAAGLDTAAATRLAAGAGRPVDPFLAGRVDFFAMGRAVFARVGRWGADLDLPVVEARATVMRAGWEGLAGRAQAPPARKKQRVNSRCFIDSHSGSPDPHRDAWDPRRYG